MAKNSQHRDLFPGALEIMILQSLRHKPMHGYALVKHIKQVSDDLLQVEEGSLYPALQRMLKEGRLEARPRVDLRGFIGSLLKAFVISKAKLSASSECSEASTVFLPQPKPRRGGLPRFSLFFLRNRPYEDISISIQEHIDERIDELMGEGMPHHEAEQNARREFGNVTL